MIRFQKKNLLYKVYTWLPILVLFISVFNEFDLNYLNIDYFSFNFPFILIFYFALKAYQRFDYFLVFLAGLFNSLVRAFNSLFSSKNLVLLSSKICNSSLIKSNFICSVLEETCV